MTTTWKFQAGDPSTDPEYILCRADGTETTISVQDGRSYRGGFTVTECSPKDDANVWIKFVSTGLKTLAAAKRQAEELYKQSLN